ncbi:MAG: sigma-70 family RNA polymerase sigma factor [Bacilli bacterium]|nr:sigma-70 family RNA polymerase sigma factor [Bacilli bacterium]
MNLYMKDKATVLLENESIVYSIINKYTYYFDKDDLYQVGMIGLMDAYEHYKGDKNTKFSSFAYFYVLGKVKEYIRNSNMIKTSKELVKLNSSIEKARDYLTQRIGRIPTDDDIALFLEIDIEHLRQAKEANSLIMSLEENSEEINLYSKIGYEEKLYREDILDLKKELNKLNEYDQNIIKKRYEEGLTQSELSQELGINQVKVSRKEKEILTRLRTRLM